MNVRTNINEFSRPDQTRNTYYNPPPLHLDNICFLDCPYVEIKVRYDPSPWTFLPLDLKIYRRQHRN